MMRGHLSSRLRTEIDEVVRELRPRRFAPFHVSPIARRLGIVVEHRQLGAELLGLTLDHERILLNRGHLAGASRAFTFAHEVAHVMERRGRFGEVPQSRCEWFADVFARELLVPRGWLAGASPEEICALVAKRWVSAEVVCLQVAAIGRAPEIFQSGGNVLCRDCGERLGLPECACLTARNRPSQARKLPTITSVLSAITRPSVPVTALALPI